MNDYFDHPATSISQLLQMERSPQHYKHALEFGRPDREVLRLGRLYHMAALELDRYSREVAVFKGRRQGQKWEDFQLANKDKIIANETENQTALSISTAIMQHAECVRLLSSGDAEQAVYWTHDGGRECKSRFDFVSPNRNLIVDLKTTRDCEWGAFGRSAGSYRYHVRAAFYIDAYRTTYGRNADFVFIAVEKEPPYAIGIYELTPEQIESGRATYERLLVELAECERKNEWPGPNAGKPKELYIPPYHLEPEETFLDIGGESVAV